jgi:hypothetical protein
LCGALLLKKSCIPYFKGVTIGKSGGNMKNKEKTFRSKFKDFFSDRRNVIILISVVSFLILVLVVTFFWMIYTEDKPNFIPEETKGEIRKGIEDNIGQNVKKVAPDLGQAIIDASFDNQKTPQSTDTKQSDAPQLYPVPTDGTEGWKEFVDRETGLTFLYPPEYLVRRGGKLWNVVSVKDSVVVGEVPNISIQQTKLIDTTISVEQWVDANKNIFIGEQKSEDVYGFNNRKPFIFGANTGQYFDWQSMGDTRAYVFKDNGYMISVVLLPAIDSQIKITEKIINSM